MAETTFYPDASVESTSVSGGADDASSTTWNTVHGADPGTNGNASTTASYVMVRRRAGDTDIRRIITLFDTSAIGSDVVSAAVYGLKTTTDQADNHTLSDKEAVVGQCTPISNTNIEAADYANMPTTANWDTASDSGVTFATMVAGSDNTFHDWTFNATGIGWIDTGGVTKLACRTSWDREDTEPGETDTTGSRALMVMSGTAGTASDPRLVVTHAPAGGATDNALAWCNF